MQQQASAGFKQAPKQALTWQLHRLQTGNARHYTGTNKSTQQAFKQAHRGLTASFDAAFRNSSQKLPHKYRCKVGRAASAGALI